MDDLRAQIGGRQELDEGGLPLQAFTGTVDGWDPIASDRFPGRYNIQINFSELEDVVCTPGNVWEFPVAQVVVTRGELGKNPRKNSAYGVLQVSIEKHVSGYKSLDDLIGLRLHMERTPGHKTRRPDEAGEWKEVEASYWEVVGMDGAVAAGALDAEQLALSILDGKTRQQFQTEAFKNAVLREDKRLYAAMVTGVWLKGLEGEGKVAVGPDGSYTVVK